MPVSGDARSSDTKARILSAAEQLFVERGFSGTSLRAVTGAAEVNLAAVHYHFGSKEGLLHALLDQHVGPVNQRRLEALEAVERAAGPGPARAQDILRAFVEPALQLERGVDSQRLRSLLGRIYGEPPHLVGPLLQREFGDLGRRFVDALARSLPSLAREEVRWRFQFVIGALLYVISGNALMAIQQLGEQGQPSTELLLEGLLRFVCEGMSAMPTAWSQPESPSPDAPAAVAAELPE